MCVCVCVCVHARVVVCFDLSIANDSLMGSMRQKRKSFKRSKSGLNSVFLLTEWLLY